MKQFREFPGSTVTNVVDGDTLVMSVDLGFKIRHEVRIRLKGCNCPELRSDIDEVRDHAKAAKAFTEEWVDTHKDGILLRTFGPDKYGRWLGDLKNKDGEMLSQALLQADLAVTY